ncbi:unnamed protein product [Peronospora belbahrii]|uniref:PX domain-containing protein n=1 Tax=Peronospora belbahrii TaxID=622444 RepID=A0AAU9LBR4_9STRA|nr:unnamed protein product [Peronospora belbahrii]CAH0515990.1 unnamed protein product [Peronospora belbahrii]
MSRANSESSPTSPQIVMPSQTTADVLESTTSRSYTKPCGLRSSIVPLQRLECVRVAKKIQRNGHRFYVAAAFLQRSAARRRLSECVYKTLPASKLSPQAMRDFMMTEREPDFVVERRFSEFRHLRNDAVALARSNGAHVKTCPDCQDLLRMLLSSKHRNWTVKRMFGNKEHQFALLTTFVNDLLTLTVSVVECVSCGNVTEDMDKSCRIREQVAERLEEFLKPSYEPTLGII